MGGDFGGISTKFETLLVDKWISLFCYFRIILITISILSQLSLGKNVSNKPSVDNINLKPAVEIMFQNANINQPSLYNLSFLLPPDWKSKKGSMSLSPRHPHMRWEGTVRIKSVKKRGVRAPYKEVRWKIRPREERPEQMHLGTNYFPHHCHQEMDFWLFGCILRICFGQVTGSLPSSPQPLPFAKCNHLLDPDPHLVKTFNTIK